MIEFANLISTVGFPIVLTFYLLVRFEKVLNNNTKTMNEVLRWIKKK